MSRALVILNTAADRKKAMHWLAHAPDGCRVEFKRPRRSNEQNDRFWAMLTDVSEQVKHHGLRLTPEDWKLLFLDALKREKRIVPNLDGNGLVSLSRSSDLSKDEMTELMELISAYGASHGVIWGDETEAA